MQETLKKLEQDSLAEGNSEVDELLTDINGESNRDSTKSDPPQNESYDSAIHSRNKYITGSKELDEMVESILGKGWEKDEMQPAPSQPASEYSQKELDDLIASILGKGWDKDDEPSVTLQTDSDVLLFDSIPDFQDSLEQAEPDLEGDDTDLDAIVATILSDSDTGPVFQQARPGNHGQSADIVHIKSVENNAATYSSSGISPPSSVVTLPATQHKTADCSDNIDPERKANFPVLITLLLLIALISAIGLWKYSVSNDDTAFTMTNTDRQEAKTEVRTERKHTSEAYQPATQEPVIQAPATQELVAQEPVIQEPVAQEPVAQEPVIQEPVIQEPVAQEPVTQEPDPTVQSAISPAKEYQTASPHGRDDNNMGDVATETPAGEASLSTDEAMVENELQGKVNPGEISAEPVAMPSGNESLTIVLPVEKSVTPEVGAEKPARETIIYTVVDGDTFWSIAKRFVRNPYKYTELAKQSKISNPELIYPGNIVIIIKNSR